MVGWGIMVTEARTRTGYPSLTPMRGQTIVRTLSHRPMGFIRRGGGRPLRRVGVQQITPWLPPWPRPTSWCHPACGLPGPPGKRPCRQPPAGFNSLVPAPSRSFPSRCSASHSAPESTLDARESLCLKLRGGNSGLSRRHRRWLFFGVHPHGPRTGRARSGYPCRSTAATLELMTLSRPGRKSDNFRVDRRRRQGIHRGSIP